MGDRLTAPQERYLAEIRATPGRAYNGRAGAVLAVLRSKGLIRTEFDLVPHIKGGGTQYTYRYTCWPIEPNG